MPVYEFDCPACGRFDARRDMQAATRPADCPSCGEASRRIYTAPGVRSRVGPMALASRTDAARIDRARSGEPSITSAPAGRRLPAGAHRH